MNSLQETICKGKRSGQHSPLFYSVIQHFFLSLSLQPFPSQIVGAAYPDFTSLVISLQALKVFLKSVLLGPLGDQELQFVPGALVESGMPVPQRMVSH